MTASRKRLELGRHMIGKLRLRGLRGPLGKRMQEQDRPDALEPDVVRLDDLPARVSAKAIDGSFRHAPAELRVPIEAQDCPGISFFGRHVKSLVFSTDLAIICNCDADAVFAVYPFTCQPAITQALVMASGRPVFTGVAGTTTTGVRSAALAVQSEMQGAYGVIVNSPTSVEDIHMISRAVDIPLVLTIVTFDELVATKIATGARVVNVAAGRNTPDVVRSVREHFGDIPIIASGGKDGESVKSTIDAGADAITWVPPTMQDLQRKLMDVNRAMGQAGEPDSAA